MPLPQDDPGRALDLVDAHVVRCRGLLKQCPRPVVVPLAEEHDRPNALACNGVEHARKLLRASCVEEERHRVAIPGKRGAIEQFHKSRAGCTATDGDALCPELDKRGEGCPRVADDDPVGSVRCRCATDDGQTGSEPEAEHHQTPQHPLLARWRGLIVGNVNACSAWYPGVPLERATDDAAVGEGRAVKVWRAVRPNVGAGLR